MLTYGCGVRVGSQAIPLLGPEADVAESGLSARAELVLRRRLGGVGESVPVACCLLRLLLLPRVPLRFSLPLPPGAGGW